MKTLNNEKFGVFDAVFMAVPYLFLLGILWLKRYKLYFADIDLSLSQTCSALLALLAVSAVQLLVILNPFLKNKKSGVVAGAILSSELVLFLLFAQYHLTVAVFMLLSAVVLFLWLTYEIFSLNKGKRSDTRKLNKWCRSRSGAWVLYALCFVLLIPSVMGAYREYGDSSITGEKWSDFCNSFYDAGKKSDEVLSYEDEIEGLRVWDMLSVTEKERQIRTVALIEKDRLGISDDVDISVRTEELPERLCGYYSDCEKEICINYKHLKDGELQDVIHTVLHEMHHAFVYYTVESLDFTSEIVKESYYFSQARRWAENTEGYISSDTDYQKYRCQPIEADAEKYAAARAQMYMDYINGREVFVP